MTKSVPGGDLGHRFCHLIVERFARSRLGVAAIRNNQNKAERHPRRTYGVGNQILLMALFLVILTVAQIMIHPGFEDDLIFAGYWERRPHLEFLKLRYRTWTSRVIIEAGLMALAAANPLIWRILNIAVILLLVWITADLFGTENKLQSQIFFFIIIWLIPLGSLYSAGWITTTVNYLWCLTLGLVAMRPIKHWLLGERIPGWEYVICPLCMLYAANIEQMCAILLGVYAVFGIYSGIRYKKTKTVTLPGIFYIQLLLVLAQLCLICGAPGNRNRMLYETSRFFPEFTQMHAGEKLLMGFLENAHYYIAGGHGQVCYLLACLCGVLFLCLMTQSAMPAHRKLLKISIALCPLAAYWLCAHGFRFLLYGLNVPRGRNLLSALAENRQIAGQGNFSTAMVGIQTLIYLAVLTCVALTIYFLHGASGETALELLVLTAGFLSRVIMGFSPTIYASGDRTALFCSMAMLILILRNLCIWLRRNPGIRQRAAMAAYVGALIICNLL